MKNVSRCWTYETSVLTGSSISSTLPVTEYHSYFGPDYSLHPPIVDANLPNYNSLAYLDGMKKSVGEYMRFLGGAPSVEMQEIPPSFTYFDERDREVDEEEDFNPDRVARKRREKNYRIVDEREYYDETVALE